MTIHPDDLWAYEDSDEYAELEELGRKRDAERAALQAICEHAALLTSSNSAWDGGTLLWADLDDGGGETVCITCRKHVLLEPPPPDPAAPDPSREHTMTFVLTEPLTEGA